MGMEGFLQKEAKIPGIHKIGAAMSFCRIAGKHFYGHEACFREWVRKMSSQFPPNFPRDSTASIMLDWHQIQVQASYPASQQGRLCGSGEGARGTGSRGGVIPGAAASLQDIAKQMFKG